MRLYPYKFYQKWKNFVRGRDLSIFLEKSIGKTKSFILLSRNEEWVCVSWWKFFWIQLQVRLLRRGKPLSYVLGEHPFFTSNFIINSSVLIPRVETEYFVEIILRSGFITKRDRLLDIGTGSGVLAIEITKILGCKSVGVDICPRALRVAQKNRDLLLVERAKLVELQLGDIKKWVPEEMFSVIISNPPYIPTKVVGTLENSVKRWEPKSALDGGEDGLMIFSTIVKKLSKLLKKSGNLLLECSPEQTEILREWIRPYFVKVCVEKDQFFRERFLFAEGYKGG